MPAVDLDKTELTWIGQYDRRVTTLIALDPNETLPPDLEQVADSHDKKQAAKNEKLQQLRDIVASRKEQMASATVDKTTGKEVVIVHKGKGLLKKSKPLKSKKGHGSRSVMGKKFGGSKFDSNPDEEFDPTAIKPEDIVNKDEAKRVTDAVNEVIDQLHQLEQQINKATSADELFSPDELMEELWTPLVREGIIPVAMVPPARNRIAKLFNGANELYRKRLKEFTQAEQDKKFQNVKEGLDTLADLSGAAADTATGLMACLGTAKTTADTTKLAISVAKNGFTLGSNLLAKDFEKAGDTVGNVLTSVVQMATGNKTLATTVGTFFKAGVNTIKIGQKLAESPPKVAESFKLLAGSIAGSFSCFDTSPSTKWTDIGEEISVGIQGSVFIAKIAVELKKPHPNTAEILKMIGEAANAAVALGLRKAAAAENDPKAVPLNKELKELKQKIDAIKEDTPEKKELQQQQAKVQHELDLVTPESGGGSKTGDALEGSLSKLADTLVGKGVLEEAEKKAEEKAKKVAAEQLSEAREIMDKQLKAVFAGESDSVTEAMEALTSIDGLIAQIKADQATFAMVKNVLSAASGVVSQIVPLMGGPLKARDFAMSVVAAVMRGRELRKWAGYVDDAKRATSPQISAFAAEVAELEAQLTNDVLNAALELAQTITGSVAIAFPPADGATKVLAAAQTIKTFIYEHIYKKAKLARAWSKYKDALKNPENITALRKSMESNPSLAKYAIAYGALEMNDPFAREALRQCDLNDTVLSHKDTSASKVVSYLELKMKDDIVVTHCLNEFVRVKGELLSLSTWNKNKAAAADKFEWQQVATPNIDTALIAVENAVEESGRSEDAAQPFDTLAAACEALVKALRAFTPLTTDGKKHEQFAGYIDELADAAGKNASEAKKSYVERKAVAKLSIMMETERQKQADVAVAALKNADDALQKIDHGEGPKHLAEFCKADGATLAAALGKCATASALLVEPIDLLKDTLRVVEGLTKQDLGKWDDPNQRQPVSANIMQRTTRLDEGFSDCLVAMSDHSQKAQTELDRLALL